MRFRRGIDLNQGRGRRFVYQCLRRVKGQQVKLTMGLAELADIRVVDGVMVGLFGKLRGGVKVTGGMLARMVRYDISEKEKQIRGHPEMERRMSNMFAYCLPHGTITDLFPAEGQ